MKLSMEQFNSLIVYIDARVDEKIDAATGQGLDAMQLEEETSEAYDNLLLCLTDNPK